MLKRQPLGSQASDDNKTSIFHHKFKSYLVLSKLDVFRWSNSSGKMAANNGRRCAGAQNVKEFLNFPGC